MVGMSGPRRPVVTAVLPLAALVLALAAPGVAEAQDQDPGALFDKGLADMKAHKYAEACAELAESYRLDPHAGGLFTLAECENQWGKIESAIKDYDGFLGLVDNLPPKEKARQADRAKVAAERRAALARDVPSLTISLDNAVPEGSTVAIDGHAVAPASLNQLIPLDPGDHQVTLTTPDGRTKQQHVKLNKGDAQAITLELSTRGASSTSPPATKEEASSSPDATWKTAAFVTGGVGAAAVVVGVVTGAIVLADKSSIDSHCPTPTTCDSTADANSANAAKSLGWASTGMFVGGVAALGAAAGLWFLRPKGSAVEPVVQPGATGAYLGLRGEF
jgi:tetratricopeptide (TPR) repeat protein